MPKIAKPAPAKPLQPTPDPYWTKRNGGGTAPHDDSQRWAIYQLEQQIARLEASVDSLAEQISIRNSEAAEKVGELLDFLKDVLPDKAVDNLHAALAKLAGD